MPLLSEAEFLSKLKLKTIPPVCIFAGEEAFLQEDALAKLEQKIGATDLNKEIYYVGSCLVSDVVMTAQTPTFFGGKKLVVLKEIKKLKQNDIAKLVDYAKSPSDASCLVMFCYEKIGKKKLTGVLGNFSDSVDIVDFKQYYDNQIPKFVVDNFSQKGRSVSIPVAKMLADMCTPSLVEIISEVDKIILYCGDKKIITADDIEAACGRGKDLNLNDFANFVEQKKIKESLEALHVVLSQGEYPLLVLSSLYRVVRRLLNALALRDEGLGNSEISRELNINSYFGKDFFDNLDKFTTNDLKEGINAIAKADIELKTSLRPAEIVFQDLLLLICRK